MTNRDGAYYTKDFIAFKLRQLDSDRRIEELDFSVDEQLTHVITHMGDAYLCGVAACLPTGPELPVDNSVKSRLKSVYHRHLKKYGIARCGVKTLKKIKHRLIH